MTVYAFTMDSFPLLATVSTCTILTISTALYYWISHTVNCRYFTPSPHLKAQSIVIDQKNGIRASPFPSDTSQPIGLRTHWSLFSHSLASHHDLPCFGRRSTFTTADLWMTYGEVDASVKKIGSGLLHLLGGQSSPLMVGIFGRNSVEWVSTQLACSAYSMVTVPLYETLGHVAMKFIMQKTEMVAVICDSVEQADHLLSWDIPSLRLVVVIGMTDSFTKSQQVLQQSSSSSKKEVTLVSFTELLSIGSQNMVPPTEPKEEDTCLICYTSGSTDLPKGVTLTHKQFVNGILDFDYAASLYDLDFDNMVHLSYLPLPHIMEQVFMLLALYKGARIAFLTTDIRGLSEDLTYYRPTHLIAVPRVLARVYTEVLTKIGSWRILRWLLNRAVVRKVAEQRRGVYRQNGILDRLVCSGIRKKFGDRIRLIMCAGAPLSPEVDNFASAIFSCPVLKGYGSTEVCGIVSTTLIGDHENDTVGALKPGTLVRLADVPDMGVSVARDGIGEICVKTRSATSGYYKDEVRTNELFDADGFIHMGDIGQWTPSGALKIVDRCKSVFKLSQGEYVAPERVEQVYSTSPLVLHILVDGNSLQAFPVALVVPNFVEVRKRCSKQRHLYPDLPVVPKHTVSNDQDAEVISDEALCRHTGVRNMVLQEFNKVGKAKQLKGFEQVKAVYLCPEPFTPANGLLTPTLKMARATVRRRFAAEIAKLYEDFSV